MRDSKNTPLAMPALSAGMPTQAKSAPKLDPAMSSGIPQGVVKKQDTDSLSQPCRLPSGGIYYQQFAQGHNGEIVIAPMRGEHEETIAAVADSPQGKLAAMRHVTSQCFDLKGIPFPELIFEDWFAALMQFLALSAGDDKIDFTHVHNENQYCRKSSEFSIRLSELACDVLRIAPSPEDVNWPAAKEDPDILALKALGGAKGTAVRLMTAETASEPFVCNLPNGKIVRWKYLRLKDFIAAEEYAAVIGNTQTNAGGKLNTFLMARMLSSIDGKEIASPLEAVTWVKSCPSKYLDVIRADVEKRSFGYDVTPQFTCKHCGGTFRGALPTDGSLFRGHIGA